MTGAADPRPGRGPEVDDGLHERPAEQASLVGEWLHGRYEVLAELGWGSLGHVYLARDHLRRDASGAPEEVAVKVIRRDRLSPQSIDYLKREFRALSRLVHPNVARVYDLDVVPGRGELFFTLELLRGRTIAEATQALGWEAGVELLVQTLRALQYVHSRGFLHMDLKPQNVLVLEGEAPPRVKVLDFHLAREQDDRPDRTMRGTIAYMAPEVIRGEPTGPRADLYSLGAVAFHAFTGAPPFAGLSPMEVLRAHARERPPSFAERGAGGVPRALEAIVQRLLEKEPQARFGSANEVIKAINAALGRAFALETQETIDSAFGQAAFVGRDEVVRRALALAPRPDRPGGAPGALLITGEPGIGRSRLLGELKVLLQLEGVPALLARAAPGDEAFAPWRQLAGELMRRAGERELLAQVSVDGVVSADRLIELRPRPDLPEHVQRTSAMADLLRELTQACPTALLLDDLHQADPGTIELVRALVSAGPAERRLLVLTAREPDPDDASLGAQAVRELARDERVTRVELARLPRQATAALLASMVGVRDRPLPDDFVERVWAVTGGNPRFVEETMRSLVEADVLRTRDGALTVGPDVGRHLLDDESLRALAARRVARLEPDQTLLLAACAALRRPRPLPFLAACAALPLPRAREALRELLRRGLVAPAGGVPGAPAEQQPLAVEHESLRAAALDALDPERRRQLHRQAARLIETRHPVAADPVSLGAAAVPAAQARDRADELRWHHAQAGDLREAVRWTRVAAEAAARRRELVRARELWGEALALFDRARAEGLVDDDPRALEDLLVRAADALAATGDRARGLALLERAPAPGARTARVRARLLKDQGDLPAALAQADQALRLAEGDPVERARCLAERASVLQWSARYASAREDALAALAALGDPPPLEAVDEAVAALDTLHHACRFSGDEEGATSALRQALRLRARAHGDSSEERAGLRADRVDAGKAALVGDGVGAHVPRSVVEAAIERAAGEDDLVAHYRRRIDLLLAAGDPEGAAWALLNLGHVRHAAGRLADALRGYRRALALFERTGCRIGAALVRQSLARALAQAGAAGAATEEAARALDAARGCGAPWAAAQAEAALAEARLAGGDLKGARAALDRALDAARALKNVPLQAELHLAQAELALARGEVDHARASLEAHEATPHGARTVAQADRALVAQAALAVAAGADDARALAVAEGRAARALEQATARGALEQAWRAAAARAAVRRARGDAQGELDDLVRALDILRDLSRAAPDELRASYLAHPDRVAVRERFVAARGEA